MELSVYYYYKKFDICKNFNSYKNLIITKNLTS